jgi:hypothetical protein
MPEQNIGQLLSILREVISKKETFVKVKSAELNKDTGLISYEVSSGGKVIFTIRPGNASLKSYEAEIDGKLYIFIGADRNEWSKLNKFQEGIHTEIGVSQFAALERLIGEMYKKAEREGGIETKISKKDAPVSKQIGDAMNFLKTALTTMNTGNEK